MKSDKNPSVPKVLNSLFKIELNVKQISSTLSLLATFQSFFSHKHQPAY